ncbi:2-hydroxyacyl-CoA dehydratase family protein [Sporomusa sp.]|uniref:2-hydroxyacyl-CoA dehydratase family protein n=1 Tax=Sporomusa sp. TaxID=2078658 RepID=UPI002D155379|nr:2-hydroxyacyl-CoA dehydratase family protein [Sporomusa sp.]HWR09128.1 2-hydroxyacyl-CoA dehydratase family protein [Sporomusa sp.]
MLIEEVQNQRDYLIYSKEVHGYSPAVGRLLDLSASYIYDAEKAYNAGKNAIWCRASAWEVPLLYSLDIIPAVFSEMGRLSDREAMLIAEDYYQFPVETCSMVKCTVGQWHKRRGTSINRILGTSSACEPYNMAYEIMKTQGYDVYCIESIYRAPGVDGNRLAQLKEFFIEQIYGVTEWLTGNRVIDAGKLKVEILRKNRLIDKIKRILDLRIQNPFYIRSLPTILLLNIGLSTYFGKPAEFEETVDLLINELETAPVSPEDLQRVIPLVWGYGTGQEFGVYDAIDQAGGALLGLRGVPLKKYREDVPPIEALVHYIYDNHAAGAGTYMRELIEQQIDKINARGLLLYGYIGCSFSSVDKELFREHFHHKGIPSISLEGSYQVGPPTGQVLTRIKAFIEMLS